MKVEMNAGVAGTITPVTLTQTAGCHGQTALPTELASCRATATYPYENGRQLCTINGRFGFVVY